MDPFLGLVAGLITKGLMSAFGLMIFGFG